MLNVFQVLFPSVRQIGAVLMLFNGSDLCKTAAQIAHSLCKMLARGANCKTCRVFLPAALNGRIKRVYILKNSPVSAVAVNFGKQTSLTERTI